MNVQLLFTINVALCLVAWALVAKYYVWPALRDLPRLGALRPLLLLNSFRASGVAFVIPGVVSPELPAAFAVPAAYGDLLTALLALAALATLGSSIGLALVWTMNIVGTVDLLFAFYNGIRTGVGDAPGLQGAAYFIPTVYVPLLFVAHALAFRILVPRRAHGTFTEHARVTRG